MNYEGTLEDDNEMVQKLLSLNSDRQEEQVQNFKINEFEKSLLIKFEEFEGEGSGNRENAVYTKNSERISDRIYEKNGDESAKEETKH